MKSVEYIDAMANELERLFLAYQRNLRMVAHESLDSPRAWQDLNSSRITAKITSLRVDWALKLTEDLTLIPDALDEVAALAAKDAGLPLAVNLVSPLNAASSESVHEAIRDAMRVDAASVSGALRKIRLNVAMKAASGADPETALMIMKTGMLSQLDFTRPDRAGKRWSTSVYVRTLMRAALVNAYTESYAFALLSSGVDVAQVDTGDGSMLQFSLTGETPNLPTLEEVMPVHFHPNAVRLVSKA